MANQTFPTASVPITQSGLAINRSWLLWLQQFALQPAAPLPVSVGVSPFTYVASGTGNLVISGGAITSVTFTRRPSVVSLGTIRTVPMSNADMVSVGFTGSPTAVFIPG